MANTTAAPIVVPSSESWDGNDGPWSTFNIHVGTPPQPARVLVSTALGESWVISDNSTQGGCLPGDASNCASLRGALINVNKSSTWQDQGIFGVGLELNLPDYINNYDNGDYGIDVLGVGFPGSTLPSLPNMVVAALATKDYYLGYFGVTSHPTNFTQFNDPHPSYLSTLKANGTIPSLSYAYTAGAQYRFKKVDGSLVLGGYDASKFEPNNLNFGMATDISRDLVVGLQAITYSDAKHTSLRLLNEGIFTFIDATVPQIWLPQDACTLFEDALGITYNDTVDRYLVNDTTHKSLLSQNASLTFVVGNDISSGATVNITFPYAAFDLALGPPIVNSTQNYFPLRRAANDTQYTLGRTFLQEAYLMTNYEFSNFSVSQNIWVENAPSQIESLPAVNNTKSPLTKTTQNSSSISIGAIVGIVVAAVVLIILAAGLIWFCIRKRRKGRKTKEEMKEKDALDPFGGKPEMDGVSREPIGELYAPDKLGGEMDSSSNVELGSKEGVSAYDKNTAEMAGSRGGVEMEGTKGGVEMEASKPHLRSEMEGDHLAPIEMYAGEHGLYELPSPNTESSDVPSPLGPPRDRRSRVPSWSRRNKPTPSLPHSESSEISGLENSSSERRSGGVGPMWSGRRPPRGTPRTTSAQDVSSPTSESSRERQHSGGDPFRHADPISRYGTPMSVASAGSISSPTSESSRDVQRRRGDRLTEQLQRPSQTSLSADVSSPSSDSRERLDSGADRWNNRSGNTARSTTPRSLEVSSPSNSDRDRRRRMGSGSTAGAPSERTNSGGPHVLGVSSDL